MGSLQNWVDNGWFRGNNIAGLMSHGIIAEEERIIPSYIYYSTITFICPQPSSSLLELLRIRGNDRSIY